MQLPPARRAPALVAMISMLLGALLGLFQIPLDAPPFELTEDRIIALNQLLGEVMRAEAAGPRELELASLALALFTTNILTCLAAAFSPLIPLLLYRLAVRLESWRSGRAPKDFWWAFRIIALIFPLTAPFINGVLTCMIAIQYGLQVMAFAIPELLALLTCSTIGIRAALNSSTPSGLTPSYRGSWKWLAMAASMLGFAATAEAFFILG